MKLTKQQKKEIAKELAKSLKVSSHLYFTAYQGLKFKELEDLRGKLRELGGSYRVLKNSVLKHALAEASFKISEHDVFEGPNALLFGGGDDPVSPAKILLKFSKEFEKLRIKGGYVDGKWVSPADCQKLANLGTKREIMGRLAGTLYSAVAQLAWVLAAPIRDLALVLKALQEKKSAEAAAK